jgi:hypothetical protein
MSLWPKTIKKSEFAAQPQAIYRKHFPCNSYYPDSHKALPVYKFGHGRFQPLATDALASRPAKHSLHASGMAKVGFMLT